MVNDPIGKFGAIAQGLSRGPLGIIALFLVLVYGMAVLVLTLQSDVFNENQIWAMLLFLIIFPFVVLATFAWLVSRHHPNLYPPSDYGAGEFLSTIRRESFEIRTELQNVAKNIDTERDLKLYEEDIFRGRLALAPNCVESERNRGMDSMRKILNSNPKDRNAAILLGRIYRTIGANEIDLSIETLTVFLNVKSESQEYDMDYADVIYNRACYYSVKAECVSKGAYAGANREKSDDLVQLAVEDLRRSIGIVAENSNDARQDRDFDFIRKGPEFRGLVGD